MSHTAKIVATVIAGLLCGAMCWFTKGQSGIGWFIIALLVIW